MGEPHINSKPLEDAMPGTTNSARNDFYDKFKREAAEHDRDFIKKYDGDLNTTLIFAGLFSAVTSAFIVAVQPDLQPNYQQFSYQLLNISTSVALGIIPTGDAAKFIPKWTGPDPTTVHVQAVLYSSLAASLFAALLAMLGKQWLNLYERVEMHGSPIDRSRHRQRKMNGIITWRFDLVMECLPLMLQIALLLLGYALSNYLYSITKVVASVAIGFTAFGLLFYFLIVSAATLSYTCPFQTPFSLIFRSLIRFDSEHKKYLERSWKLLGRIFSRKRKRPGLNPAGSSSSDHIELVIADPTNQLSPLFDKDADWDGYTLDSKCIAWMFERSMDADVIMAIMRFIPEVVWHADIQTTPLKRLYDTVLECFDRSAGHTLVTPRLRNKAYFSAKALVHLAIHRKCFGDESDEVIFESISGRHQVISKYYKGDPDPDLESTLGIIDRVFGNSEPMAWRDFSFSASHHAWMAHILLYRACDALKKGDPLPGDIKGFILHSFRPETPPPVPIVADCLSIISLVLRITPHTVDPSIVDRSNEVNPQINSIYKELTDIFSGPIPTKVDRALEAMELIAPLHGGEIAQKSHDLFHIVMQAPVSTAFPDRKKWKAARLTMHGAYKSDKFLPSVEDPQDILTFLDHHFGLTSGGNRNQDEPIQNALRALAHTSDPAAIEALERPDPTGTPFIHGIRRVFQSDKPLQLRKAALLFLPLIGHRWFNTARSIMSPDEMKRLCVDWASVVGSVEHSPDVRQAILSVLLGMIDSPHWRPHIVTDNWKLLEYYASLPGDSRPLKRCIDNPELIDTVRDVNNPVALGLWLEILWSKHGELLPDVRDRLETVTREVAQGRRRIDLERCQKALESEFGKAEGALIQFSTWDTGPTAVALRKKVDNLQQARTSLLALMRS